MTIYFAVVEELMQLAIPPTNKINMKQKGPSARLCTFLYCYRYHKPLGLGRVDGVHSGFDILVGR